MAKLAKVAKLFNEVETAYDPKNRPVFICKGKAGFHVYKAGTGFTSRSFSSKEDTALIEIFDYQKHDGHNNAFYRDGDRVAPAAPVAIPQPPVGAGLAASPSIPVNEVEDDKIKGALLSNVPDSEPLA